MRAFACCETFRH